MCEMLAHFDAVLHPHHNSLLCQDLHDFVDYASKKDLCEVQYKSKQQSHLKRSPFDIRYRINPELCLDSRTSSASLKAIVNGENVITKLAPPLTASLTPVFNKEISSKSMNKAIVAKRRLDNKRLVPFRNIQEAAQKLVLDPFAIERVCEGDRSTLFGMEFYYIDAQQYPVMNARELEIACSEIRQYLEKSSKKYSTHLQGFTNSTTSATAASSSGNGNADKDGSSKNLQSLSNNNNRRTMNSSSQNYRIQISSPGTICLSAFSLYLPPILS